MVFQSKSPEIEGSDALEESFASFEDCFASPSLVSLVSFIKDLTSVTLTSSCASKLLASLSDLLGDALVASFVEAGVVLGSSSWVLLGCLLNGFSRRVVGGATCNEFNKRIRR